MNEIIEQYKKVFNSEGDVMLCGRGECIKLISLLSSKYPNGEFGNLDNGMMNIENIKNHIKQMSYNV